MWKTFCALFGLAKASFHWYQCLTKYLKEVGLVACNSVECLFMKKNERKQLKLLVLTYVDDLLFTGTEESLKEFCVVLEKNFKIRKTVDDVERKDISFECEDALETTNGNGAIKDLVAEVFDLD